MSIYLFIYEPSLDEDLYEVQILAVQLLSYAGMKGFLDMSLILTGNELRHESPIDTIFKPNSILTLVITEFMYFPCVGMFFNTDTNAKKLCCWMITVGRTVSPLVQNKVKLLFMTFSLYAAHFQYSSAPNINAWSCSSHFIFLLC